MFLNFRTPFHADVFMSFSWSVNVVGRKRWVLFPPGEEAYLRDQFNNLAYDIFSKEIHDKTKFPLCEKPGKYYDIIQEAGEAIFVPSGWHHQVWNLVGILCYEKIIPSSCLFLFNIFF